MTRFDWEKILSLVPETLTEEDKDTLLQTVAFYSPDYNIKVKYLIHFIHIIQEILKFKSEQVTSLIKELDEIAIKQGVEEAHDRYDRQNDIDQLKGKFEQYSDLGSNGAHQSFRTVTSSEELRSEIIKLEMKNEELLLELQQRSGDLMREKSETENLADKIAVLEREKQELKKELKDLQEDIHEQMNAKSVNESPEFRFEKQQELAKIIKQKNKHITELLIDIDCLEKENVSLKNKLANVCDELSETACHMNEITVQLSQMKQINEELNRKIINSEEKNECLITQLEELSKEKTKHDEELDRFGDILNSRIGEWKEILKAKDIEISKAQEEIKTILSSSKLHDSVFVDFEMTKKITEQEQQIINLKHELVQATNEINNCTELIENLKKKQEKSNFADTDQIEVHLMSYRERIQVMEEKLKIAEEDATAKAEEISEIVIQLREYEMGEFGLSEAVDRIKQLEKILERREVEIEKLVENYNNMRIEFENLEEQNMLLRKSMGLTLSEEVGTSIRMKFTNVLKKMQTLKFRLNKKEEELVKAKLKCHKLMNFINKKTQDSDSCGNVFLKRPNLEKENFKFNTYMNEKDTLEKRLLSLINENDALRNGMHEILESIHNQDGSGSVEIESDCLKRLLEALDSRHISGWYHPAMRLQAQLNNAKGKNEELRSLIHSLRKEECRMNNELREAYIRIHNLENQSIDSSVLHEEIELTNKSLESEKVEIESGPATEHILTKFEEKQKILNQEIQIQELKLSYNKIKAELEKVKNIKAIEKEELLIKIVGLEKCIAFLEGKCDSSVINSSELQSQVYVLERQVNFLRLLELTERSKNEQLYKEMLEQEKHFSQEILRIKSDKFHYLLRLEKLENDLLQCLPRSKYDIINQELMDISVKYRDTLALTVMTYEHNTIIRLLEEIKHLLEGKNEILINYSKMKKEMTADEEQLSRNSLSREAYDDLIILPEKEFDLEVKKSSEAQKSTRLEKTILTLQEELQHLAKHNKKMSQYLKEIREETKNFLETKDGLNCCSLEKEEEYKDLKEKIEILNKSLKIALNDKENFRNLFEISQDQCRSLEVFLEKEKIETKSLNDQILILQSTGEEKATIARLSHELMNFQILTQELNKEKRDLQDKLSKLLANNLNLEAHIDEIRWENFLSKRKFIFQFEYLHDIINNLRKRCRPLDLLPNSEIISTMKKKLREKIDEEQNLKKQLKDEVHEYSLKKEELQIELESLKILSASFKGDNKELMVWYNEGVRLRLEEARYKRQNQVLIVEISQLEDFMKKMDEKIFTLEESQLERDQHWENKQKIWEQSQYEIIQLIEGRNVSTSKLALSVRDNATETIPLADNFENTTEIKEEQVNTIEKDETDREKLAVDLSQRKASAEGALDCGIYNFEESFDYEDVDSKNENKETEKSALKITIKTLQNVIQQKEETIYRYQELLKQCRNEYSKSSEKFQEELRTLHEVLTDRRKAYTKLKNNLDNHWPLRNNLPKIVEKYLIKIQEMEDELTEYRATLTKVKSRLFISQQEKQKWKNLAEERLSLMDDLRHRLDIDHKSELDYYKAEIEKYQKKCEYLKGCSELLHHEDKEKICDEIEIQKKEVKCQSDYRNEGSIDFSIDRSSDKKDYIKDVKVLEKLLMSAKEESTDLKEQLRVLQLQKEKRPKTTTSITSRSGSEPKSSMKDELLHKLKTLEELLKIAKEREQDLVEGNQRRVKSAEEMARWDEKKKWEQTIKNFSSKLKKKEAEIGLLRNKNESLRNMIHKYERDRNSLELQFKATKDCQSSSNCHIATKLTLEKSDLEKEITCLRNKIEIQKFHERRTGASLLYDKLENQERKLALFAIASQGRSTVVEELEKFEMEYSNLEKINLKLKSENLALKLELEKYRVKPKRFSIQKLESEAAKLEMYRIEKKRMHSFLTRQIDKGHGNVKKTCRTDRSSGISCATCEKSLKEYDKLKNESNALMIKYMKMIDKNNELEEELKKCQCQIQFFEEKHLAESISRTNNLRLTSELSQELLQVKAQLTHKTYLLHRVKALLTKAACKEKATSGNILSLQNGVTEAAVIREN